MLGVDAHDDARREQPEIADLMLDWAGKHVAKAPKRR